MENKFSIIFYILSIVFHIIFEHDVYMTGAFVRKQDFHESSGKHSAHVPIDLHRLISLNSQIKI